MSVELRHLRYFVAVAEELHFGRAAERLHISQPSLSQAIRALESELGCAVFNRTSRQVEPTTAGEVLLERARATLATFDAGIAAAREAGGGVAGQLRVGVTPVARHGLAPAALGRFGGRHPHVEVTKREELTGPLIADLLAGELDVGLVYCAERVDGIAYEPLKDQPLVVVVDERHRLADRASVALAELADERFLMPRASLSPGFRGAFDRLCLIAGFSPRPADETIEFDEDLVSVRSGRGIVVTTRDYVGERVPGLRVLRLDPPESLPIEIATLEYDRSPLVRRFVDVCRELRGESGWLIGSARAAA